MIIEGLCTTTNRDGSINLAPMGPVVDSGLTEFLFRPFQSSTTYQNLKRTGCGVFHVTDDAGLIARAAIGRCPDLPPMQPASSVAGHVLTDVVRWYEFEVVSIDDSQPRTEVTTRVVHVGRGRDFWGFNRARHAILEVAILATRLHLLSEEEIRPQLETSRMIVDKTGSDDELATFRMLDDFITKNFSTGACSR